MEIRKLKLKDAPLMLEWMHDPDVVKDLRGSFGTKTLDECKKFISNSVSNNFKNKHFAIVSNKDEYMGTVSLKDINYINKSAEFGIVVRKVAMGAGYSWFGMQEILRMAFEDLGLKYVYWCVSEKNIRACAFYDKHRFTVLKDVPNFMLDKYVGFGSLKWYIVKNDDHYIGINRREVCGCRLISIKTIGTPNSGTLSFFEGQKDVPFSFKRFYYISKTPEGAKRGFHAHKELKQLIFCPYGKINLILDNGKERDEILLNDSSIGIYIDKPIWREMVWIEPNSVLCVAASDYYDESDYLRKYDDFLSFIKQ